MDEKQGQNSDESSSFTLEVRGFTGVSRSLRIGFGVGILCFLTTYYGVDSSGLDFSEMVKVLGAFFAGGFAVYNGSKGQ